MNKNIGFIGAGNMGEAIIAAIISSALANPDQVIASDVTEVALRRVNSRYEIKTTSDNTEVAGASDIMFLAIKPNCIPSVIKQISGYVKEEAIIVSIAAGQSIKYIEKLFGKPVKIVRVMPNTPALVNEGMSAVCYNSLVDNEEANQILEIFNRIGKTEIVDENLMDAVTGISGSSPAYVYMFIEAMADAAVAEGMPRGQAYNFAAQAVLGSAKMVLETGEHPGLLKDKVCSPGGTTIQAVCELENKGFRSSVISAVRECIKKSKSM